MGGGGAEGGGAEEHTRTATGKIDTKLQVETKQQVGVSMRFCSSEYFLMLNLSVRLFFRYQDMWPDIVGGSSLLEYHLFPFLLLSRLYQMSPHLEHRCNPCCSLRQQEKCLLFNLTRKGKHPKSFRFSREAKLRTSKSKRINK